MANFSFKIDQRQLMVEMKAADPLLKKAAEQAIKGAFFDPAVEEMKKEFEKHKVTQEIAGGVGSRNISKTLDAKFKKGDTPPNLWGFIGFDANEMGPDDVLEPIRRRLDPNDPEGPKINYLGRDQNSLTFRFSVSAPNEAAIYNDEATSFPWMTGISWVKRIEQGIPGVGYFLNTKKSKNSRSGGGVQVKKQIRGGRYRPTSYLSKIFNDFLRRVAGRKANGRRIV